MAKMLPTEKEWAEEKKPLGVLTTEICPECGKGLNLVAGKDGKGDWYGCSGYPNCKFTRAVNAPKPFPNDNYIAKIVKVSLKKRFQSYASFLAKGNIRDLSQLPPTELEEMHEVELLIYGLKSGDPLVDIEKNPIPPLVRRVWKRINPFALGWQKDRTPTNLRAITAYSNRMDANSPGLPYMENPGDEAVILNKYVGVDLAINKKGTGNTVSRFNSVPISFVPDKAIEEEAMKAYQEKETNVNSTTTNTLPNMSQVTPKSAYSPEQTAFTIDDIKTSTISVEDLPF